MRPQSKDDIIEAQAGVIDFQADIIEDMRLILIREAPAPEILQEARVMLGSWFAGTYPNLPKPQLRLIEGGGEGTGRLF